MYLRLCLADRRVCGGLEPKRSSIVWLSVVPGETFNGGKMAAAAALARAELELALFLWLKCFHGFHRSELGGGVGKGVGGTRSWSDILEGVEAGPALDAELSLIST